MGYAIRFNAVREKMSARLVHAVNHLASIITESIDVSAGTLRRAGWLLPVLRPSVHLAPPPHPRYTPLRHATPATPPPRLLVTSKQT